MSTELSTPEKIQAEEKRILDHIKTRRFNIPSKIRSPNYQMEKIWEVNRMVHEWNGLTRINGLEGIVTVNEGNFIIWVDCREASDSAIVFFHNVGHRYGWKVSWTEPFMVYTDLKLWNQFFRNIPNPDLTRQITSGPTGQVHPLIGVEYGVDGRPLVKKPYYDHLSPSQNKEKLELPTL